MVDSEALRVLGQQVRQLAEYFGVAVPFLPPDAGGLPADVHAVGVVFQRLAMAGAEIQSSGSSVLRSIAPLGGLETLDAIFPSSHIAAPADRTKTQFQADLSAMLPAWEGAEDNVRICYLMWLLERYGWCLASPVAGEGDVSLYVAGKIEAARQACLARPHESDTPYLLVMGDISGIQDYIFDIASIGVGGGVAKRLRGRSLYVQLLSEVASLRCLTIPESSLPTCNVIMSSGGKFLVLLPNTEQTRLAATQLQSTVDQWLLDNVNGEIGINLSVVEFGEVGFNSGPGGFGDLLSEANRKRLLRKSSLFSGVLSKDGRWNEEAFVRPTEFGGLGACRSCRKHPMGADEVCDVCRRDAQMGRQLPKADYLSFYDDPEKGSIPVLGWSVDLDGSFPEDGAFLVQQLNSFEVPRLPKCAFTCRFIPKHLPLNGSGDVTTFEEIADSQPGKKLLAHLKADVDHMGRMFAFGMKREPAENSLDSVSRILEMSFALDLFFSGYLARLMEDKDFASCYSVFAGGDDLYIIGPREAILGLARRLRGDFARYVCNDELTLSAGIVFRKPGMPIAQVSKDAGEALEQAKEQGRNRLHLLGKTMPWHQAEATLADYKALRDTLTHNDCPSALLYRMKRYSQMAEKAEAGDVLSLRYQSLMAHDRRRNVEKSNPEPWEREASGWMGGMAGVTPGAPSRRTGISEAGVIVQLALYERGED